jgi:hypothetical protein
VPRSNALAAWLGQERAANRLGILALCAMAVPASLVLLSAGSVMRWAAALAAVALGASVWRWSTRSASGLRRTLDTLVEEDRLGRKHDGVVDAYVIQGIKTGRRFGFDRLLRKRNWLGVLMLVCVALALRPSPDPDDQLPVDVAPLHDAARPNVMASSESELVDSIELVAGGDAALRERKFDAARQLFEKAYVVRQTLHQLTPEDTRLATAVLVIQARLARVTCLEGDTTAAAKRIHAALDMLQGSAGVAGKERPDLESWLVAARTRYQRGGC